MMSLFTSFDLNIFYFSLFFLSIYLFSVLSKFYFLSSMGSFTIFFNILGSFFYTLKPLMFNKFSLLLILSSFISIVSFNILSVFPFNFPFTSQFGPLILFSMSLWLMMILFGLVKNFKGFISHFIPEGSPLGLSFILFMIEMISNLIRPITLTVRLVANILAGHLLMILLSQMIFSLSMVFPFYLGLNLVEMFVALIQSYIFCTMVMLYFGEVH